jgi:hypothetical protein
LQSKNDPISADSFLDRYSLPRIARLIAPKAFLEEQQRQQNKSKKSSATNQPTANDTNSSDDLKADNPSAGELFLLYRHLKKYKIYHAVNAKSGTNRKKGIKIPQDFAGEQKLLCLFHQCRVDMCSIAANKTVAVVDV